LLDLISLRRALRQHGTGSVLRPYDTMVEAVNAAPSGSLVQIFASSYAAATGHILVAGADGRSMRLEALLGQVVIGPAGSRPSRGHGTGNFSR
jgi:hypothetical protein